MRPFLLTLGLMLLRTQVHAAPVMTRFNPTIHGFKFVNTFVDDEVDSFDTRKSGFCAGMSFNMLDYFKSGKKIPNQWWTPARGTPLERQILDRHKTANFRAIGRMAELEFNPGGERDKEFYGWGIADRIPELRAFIDKGEPIPIILRGAGNGHHEVLAIGYDMGAYRGDKKGAVADFTIFVCDPNYPGEVTKIKPDPSRNIFVYSGGTAGLSNAKWLTWFCDTNYSFKDPGDMPTYDFVNDNKVGGLLLSFDTGSDDLRGGKDGGNSYIDINVKTTAGPTITFPRASLGSRWLSDVNQSVFVPLRRKLDKGSIESVEIVHHTEGGLSPDNWTMKSLNVQEVGKSLSGEVFVNSILRHGQHRFDGNARTLTVRSTVAPSPDKTRTIFCTFRTDGDDLRGGSDNVNLVARFSDGTLQRFDNVNQGIQWKNNSINTVKLELDRARNPDEISGLDLSVGRKGILLTDNWTMGVFTAEYVQQGVNHPLALWGQHRFTGSSFDIGIPCQTRFAADKSQLLHLMFNTGGDDLRGGNDNLKVKVTLKSGRTEVFPYVNQGVQWNNNSRSDVTLLLSAAIKRDEIASVELEIDRGGDNWSMANVEVWLRLKNENVRIIRNEAFRFTGDSPRLILRP